MTYRGTVVLTNLDRQKHEKASMLRWRRQRDLKPGDRDWQQMAIERANKQAAELLANDGKRRPNQCTAMTTGTWGPQRPCPNPRRHGLEVCAMHGGRRKATIAAAKRRFLEELDPSINALREVRDQNEHYPSKLGAALKFIERAIGKQEAKTDEHAGRPHVIIGVAIGGIPTQQKALVAARVETRRGREDDDEDDDDIQDGDIVTPTDGTSDYLNESDDE